MLKKPFAEACLKNSIPILGVVRERFTASGEILEIASGTGQHAVYFAEALPDIKWQTSDLEDAHAGIQMWLDETDLDNILPPLLLDVTKVKDWPEKKYSGVFSANTAHIMSTEAVEKMFSGVARVLKPDALFLLYGPFMYQGKHSSESNENFDCWLKSSDPQRGLRDVDWLKKISAEVDLILEEDVAMPANNRMLIWKLVEKR